MFNYLLYFYNNAKLKIMKLFLLTLLLAIQSGSLTLCQCSHMSWGSDGAYSMNVSYQVPSGSGCCGSGATNGHVGEVLVGNSGQTLMVDYCEMSGADAQFFCC